MSRLRTALKVLMAGALLASAGYSLSQLRGLAAAKKALAAPGASPEAALAALAASDKSGVVAELLKAQLEQVGRLGGLPGESLQSGPPSSEPPEEPEPEVDAGPPGAQRLFTASGPSSVGSGGGVLIDHKTGRRLVARTSPARRAAAARAAPAEAFSGLLADDLRSRRNRASALLLATVAVAVILVVRARRAMGV